MTRVIFAAALALQGALTAYPKVEVATIHRNTEIEGIRATAPPGEGSCWGAVEDSPPGTSRWRSSARSSPRSRPQHHRGGQDRSACAYNVTMSAFVVGGVADVIVVERVERPTEN